MPAIHSRKPYLEYGYYHLYNRGVEKRDIFLDKQDYTVFLSYLHDYLTPKDITSLKEALLDPTLYREEKDKIRNKIRLNNFAKELRMLSYCLMPNHFHFLIKQQQPHTIDTFMNSLGTRYTMYFNKKYKRVGSLYQGVYKAAPLTSQRQLLGLSRYIHKQAYSTQPSSSSVYLGQTTSAWVHPDEILQYFSITHPEISYETFLKESDNHENPSSFPTLED